MTVKPSGGDYTTLSAAEAGEQGDMVSLDRRLDIECHPVNDTTPVNVSGWTTDATRYIRIYAAQNHLGVWTTGVYNLTGSSSAAVLMISTNYVRLEGLQVDCAYTGASAAQNIDYNAITGAGVGYVERCLIRRSAAATGGTHFGFRLSDTDWTIYVSNCIAWWEGTNLTGSRGIGTANAGVLRTYNCTVVDFDSGLARSTSATHVAKNCLLKPVTNAFTGVPSAGTDYNASSLATGTGGANDRTSQTFTFVNAGARDYHLASTDAGAKGFGADLSGDGSYPISVDVDNVTRTGTWDIGADQTATAVPVIMNQYRQRWN